MKRALVMLAVVSCGILWSAPAFCGPNMQDGLWEITTSMEMKGMPSGMMKPVTNTTCLTQKNAVPEKPQKTECKMTNSSSSGNTVNWTVTCPNTVSKGVITYAGNTFEGTTETTTTEGGQKMHMKSKMKGKRLGPCK